jgi:RHS repeat-associated protein
MAVGGILKALKALGRALKSRVSKKGNAQCGNGSHPIYLVTGENFDQFTDFVSGGLFEWKRHYTTGRAREDSPIGHGFRHFYQRSLSLRLHRATFTDWDGVVIEFPRFERGSNVTRSNGYVLRRLERGYYRLTHRDEPAMFFSGGEFDGTLRLTRIARRQRELTFAYDTVGRLVAALETERRTTEQRRFELRYDEQNHVTHVLEIAGGVQPAWSKVEPLVRAAYLYSAAAEQTHAWDAMGGSWTYEYDAWHRWTKQKDPRGYAFDFRYDAVGRCVGASGQDGLWWCKVDYYPDQKLTRYVEGDDAHWEYHYDSDGFIVRIVDPHGGVKTRERDGEGKIVREVDSGGRVIEWLYDGDGAHYARRDRFGNVFPTEMETPRPPNPFARKLPDRSLGFLFAGVIAPAREAIFGVDASVLHLVPPALAAQARLTLRVRPPAELGAPPPRTDTHLERDALGRRLRETDTVGRSRSWQYDASGNLVASRDRDGCVSTRMTASWNLVGERCDPLGNGIKYDYSKIEQVVGLTDPLGNVTRWDYDAKKRLVRVHRSGALSDEYVYDDGDHFVEKRDGVGRSLFVNEIHENHLVRTRKLASGGEHRYDYDDRGRITEASTEAHDVRLAYGHGRQPLMDVRDGRGVNHHREGATAWVTEILERFRSRRESSERGFVMMDPAGRATSIIDDRRGSVRRYCSNGTVEILQYDEAGRLESRFTHRSDDAGRTKAQSTSYMYSGEGDLLGVADSARGTTRYEVDEAHRLRAEIGPHDERREYLQDPAGNVYAKPGLSGLRVGRNNLVEASSDEVFEFDERDRLASRRSLRGATTEYEYDSFDMLVRVRRRGLDGTVELDWTASYDALGRRIECGPTNGGRAFYWDGDRLAAEVFPDGRFRVYQYASRESLTPLSFVEYESTEADPGAGSSYHVFSNQVGVPLCVEDEEGNVVWWANRIDPYGLIDLKPGTSLEYNLRWPGHYFDPDTGLHYNRYRYYDPGLGRYLQADPTGYAGSDVNLYSYCPNPLVQVDVLGLTHEGKSQDPTSDSSDKDGQSRPPAGDDAAPPPRLSNDDGQAAVDLIHETLPEKAQAQSVTTLTQLEDGRLVLTNSDGTRPAQREAARTLLGDGLLIPDEPGNPGYLKPADRPLADPSATTPTHGEPRGMQAGDQYGSPADTQWSGSSAEHGGAACSGCEASQQDRGVKNGTGFQSQGGRYDRGGGGGPP